MVGDLQGAAEKLPMSATTVDAFKQKCMRLLYDDPFRAPHLAFSDALDESSIST